MWTKHDYGQDDGHVDFKEPRHKHKDTINNTIIVKIDLFIWEAK